MDATQLNELFFDDNYSIENLLKQAQQLGLSLGELRQILAQHQQNLNQSSLELFNNNYDRFYKLSYIISCLNEPIQRLTEPIVQFRDKISQVCKNHDDYLKQLNDKLHSLEDTSRNKEYSRRLIELIKRRDRLEEQLNVIDWSVRAIDSTNPSGQMLASARDADILFQTKCDHLERVNVELYHLSNQIRAINPTHDELIPIKKGIEANLKERQLQIDKWFENTFLEAVKYQDKTLITLVVRTYEQKDSLHDVDIVWRNKIIGPYLKIIVTDSQLTSRTTQTCNLLLEFLNRNVELIGGKFIIKSFWFEVIEAMSKLDKFYSLENLDNFKSNYQETCKFLNACSDTDSGNITSSLSSYDKHKILGKFDLNGYFNQRLSQIAASVESALALNPLNEIQQVENADVSCFRIKICLHIYMLITKCWSNELYIDTLDMSFVQLACRVMNRFAYWLGKLRLSDFRITGSGTLDRQTNFLAKQDAIMRLLIDDCDELAKQIRQYFSELSSGEPSDIPIKNELVEESLKTMSMGLGNVRSLQRLIER